jgi:hypothetical protein
MSKDEDLFENYKDLYELTRKTVDEHIEFYKNKESLSTTKLFEIWRILSKQSENFDKRNWTENWHNWDKNFHAFEKHKFEARFLIQHYLTDVLEELIAKLIKNLENTIGLVREKTQHQPTDNLSELIKQEVKRQLALELAKQKRKSKN